MKKTYKKIVQWLEGVRTVELTAINIMIITIAIVITVWTGNDCWVVKDTSGLFRRNLKEWSYEWSAN